MKKIFVNVSGGVAEVFESTVPQNIQVEIIDWDNIEAGDGLQGLSEEAMMFIREKFPEDFRRFA